MKFSRSLQPTSTKLVHSESKTKKIIQKLKPIYHETQGNRNTHTINLTKHIIHPTNKINKRSYEKKVYSTTDNELNAIKKQILVVQVFNEHAIRNILGKIIKGDLYTRI